MYCLSCSRRFVATQNPSSASAWQSKITIENSGAICDAVAAFELDVGLIEGPCHQASLSVLPWLQDEMVIVAASDSEIALASRGERVQLAEKLSTGHQPR